MRGHRIAAVGLLLLVPTVSAIDTLASLEEPHAGVDKSWDILVAPEETSTARAVIFRNSIGADFNLSVYDAQGEIVYGQTGGRGVQNLPPLAATKHTFFIRGRGEFQVTEKFVARRDPDPRVEATLEGTDAYLYIVPNWTMLQLEGNVRGAWWELTGDETDIAPGENRTLEPGAGYVLTVRGDEGASYVILASRTEAPPLTPTPSAEAPGLPLAALIAGLALAALASRRR